MKFYTIDNPNEIGTHSMTLPTDSIVYVGIKSDLMFPAYFNFGSPYDLYDEEAGRILDGSCEDKTVSLPRFDVPFWYKDYVIGHFWTGSEPFIGNVNHELSGFVPNFEPSEKEVNRFSMTLSDDSENENTTYIYDVLSIGNLYKSYQTYSCMFRDENETPLGYGVYSIVGHTARKEGKRTKQYSKLKLVENSKITYSENFVFPKYVANTANFEWSFDGSEGSESNWLSGTSIGTETVDDWPVNEYIRVTPRKVNLQFKVTEQSQAFIYHPLVTEGE